MAVCQAAHDFSCCRQELLGRGPEHDEQLLGRAVQLLGLVLEPHEAQAMYSQLFAVLARAARTEQLCLSELPYAGPYSAVALAGARTNSTAPTSASLPLPESSVSTPVLGGVGLEQVFCQHNIEYARVFTAALLRAPAARRHMLADTGVMERIEALLTRKLVTSRELRVLLPTVWWSGAHSQAGDDSRVSQPGFASAVEVGIVSGPV